MAARLKVYLTRVGFAEAIVAASNQRAALEAWGSRQNLFAEGLAEPTDDAEAVQAATAQPGVVLRRAAGSKDDWGEAVALPDVPNASPMTAKPRSPKTAPRKKPKPDRSRLTAAEHALAATEAEQRDALANLTQRREELEREAVQVRRAGDHKLAAARREVDAAERAYRAAGGQST